MGSRVATLLMLLLTACAAPLGAPPAAAPSWTLDPYAHPTVARGEHLAEVGVAAGSGGRARDTARKRALDQINASIQVALRSEIEVRTHSLSENGAVDWSEELDESIRLSSSGELPGHEVLETWTDPTTNESHVLVAVRRRLLLDELLPGVEQALAAADEHLSPGADDPVARLTGLLAAHGRLAPALAQSSRAHVIASGSRDERRSDELFGACAARLTEVQAELASLGASIVIDKLSGDGQAGVLDGPLAAPLVARFRFRRADGALVPMAGLPVAFVAVQGPGTAVAQDAATTDAEGRISARVVALAPTGRADSQLLVAPDVARFSASLPPDSVPHAAFVYGLPTPARTRVQLVIEQRFEDAPLERQSLGHALGDHLSAHGFDVEVLSPRSPAGRELLQRRLEAGPARPDDLRVVLRGTARAWVSTEEHHTFFFRAAAELDLLDLASGQVLAIATRGGDARWAAGSGDEAGAAGAFRALVPALRDAVDRQFVSRYLPGVVTGAAPDGPAATRDR